MSVLIVGALNSASAERLSIGNAGESRILPDPLNLVCSILPWLPLCPPPPQSGKILSVGGYPVGGQGTVSLIKPEKGTTCQLTPEMPIRLVWSAGGLTATANGPRPLVCGGLQNPNYDKCLLMGSGTWETVHSLSTGPTAGMAGVSMDQNWVFFSGGSTGINGINASQLADTFLLNAQGEKISLPDLTFATSEHCAAVLSSDNDITRVAVMGGWQWRNTMEIYQCSMSGQTPTCTKEPNGPVLNHGRYNFGCGSLQTSQGGRVALALTTAWGKPTEILDLSSPGSTWQDLPTHMDPPEGEGDGMSYSFVSSDSDPTTGYLMPVNKDFMWRVKCADASTCSFEKINTGITNLNRDVTMAIPANSGLDCP